MKIINAIQKFLDRIKFLLLMRRANKLIKSIRKKDEPTDIDLKPESYDSEFIVIAGLLVTIFLINFVYFMVTQ